MKTWLRLLTLFVMLHWPLSLKAEGQRVLINASEWMKVSQAQLAVKLLPFGVVPRNGVTIYKVTYNTQSLDDSPIEASGIVVVPDTKQPLYPWVSLQHGTITSLAEAPSANPLEGLVEGSQGFIAVVADYLGYGASSGLPHPYIIAEGYQKSLVDMLFAAKELAAQKQINLGPFFLKGYSEGGYATLALQKELETNYAAEFPITASAPSSGPYDPDLTGRIAVSKEVVSPVNIPFVVLSYNHWLAQGGLPLDSIFTLDSATLEDAFSGAYTSGEVAQIVPSAASTLFNPTFRSDFLAETSTLEPVIQLHSLLQSQSLLQGWQPKSLTRFYHCEDDEQIAVDVTRQALATFQTQGATNISSEIIASPSADRPYTHGTCPAIFSPLFWFADILIPKAP